LFFVLFEYDHDDDLRNVKRGDHPVASRIDVRDATGGRVFRCR